MARRPAQESHPRRRLGNFPQAFSDLALMNPVMHLIRVDERTGADAVAISALDPTMAGER